jgi:hypothetical protein
MMAKGDGPVDDQQSDDANNLKCPDCRAKLKKRRGRRSDKCEVVCGGCGRVFDICDMGTLEKLESQSG